MDQRASRTPELEELLEMAVKSFLQDVHTSMPGKITAFYPKQQRCDVKPLIKRRIVHADGSELLEEIPVIPDVPFQFLRGGGFFLTFPMKVGDLVTLHFMERSIDNYLEGTGTDTDPDEFRMHDFSDAVAVPGFYPWKKAIGDIDSANLVLGMDKGGVQIHLTPDGTMEVKVSGEADEAVALGGALQMFWDNVFKPVFDAHIHPTSLGPTGVTPTPCPKFDASIISTFLKLRGGG